ncbi:hypothetical protein D3C87_1375200 [compost metagenome]
MVPKGSFSQTYSIFIFLFSPFPKCCSICSPRYFTETQKSSIPNKANLSRLCSIIGLSPTFKSGFGTVSVNGCSLCPLPPAIITASIGKYDLIFLKFITFTTLRFSSTTGTILKSPSRYSITFSRLFSPLTIYLGLSWIISSTLHSIVNPFSKPLLTSPSVNAPINLSSLSTTKSIASCDNSLN